MKHCIDARVDLMPLTVMWLSGICQMPVLQQCSGRLRWNHIRPCSHQYRVLGQPDADNAQRQQLRHRSVLGTQQVSCSILGKCIKPRMRRVPAADQPISWPWPLLPRLCTDGRISESVRSAPWRPPSAALDFQVLRRTHSSEHVRLADACQYSLQHCKRTSLQQSQALITQAAPLSPPFWHRSPLAASALSAISWTYRRALPSSSLQVRSSEHLQVGLPCKECMAICRSYLKARLVCLIVNYSPSLDA